MYGDKKYTYWEVCRGQQGYGHGEASPTVVHGRATERHPEKDVDRHRGQQVKLSGTVKVDYHTLFSSHTLASHT